ncbi:MAG: thioredoxin family protein [Cyanobacteria bacterium P01_G01_bin.19]
MNLPSTQKFLFSLITSVIISCLLAWTTFITPAIASSAAVDVYFFHSKTCPHCQQQKPVLEKVASLNEEVKLHAYEVGEQPQVWQAFQAQHQLKSSAVPRTVIGNRQFVGYSESNGKLEYSQVYQAYIGYHNQIIAAIEAELGHSLNLSDTQLSPNNQQADSALQWKILLLPIIYLLLYPLLAKKFTHSPTKSGWTLGLITISAVSLFGFFATAPDGAIETFARSLPFPLFVSTIALADGFNPCAFTVLIILLSLLTHTRSRQQMAIVGSTFVATSAVMYFLFIMIMVLVGSLFLEQYGTIAMLVLGIVVAIAGLINFKDYFWFKRGFSLSLSAKQQLTISKKASQISRQLTAGEGNRTVFLTALGGTVLLAIFVNIIELGCTAILPAVYMTSLLQYCTVNRWLCSTFWTGIYAIVYVIPLMLILLNFIYSFKSSRLSEAQGKILKLTAGIFMLFFGVLMIFKPELLTFS